ncbi:MAG: Rrf2 family transcriptional regulator [Clostridiales bacterium]|nr:Rrf2 family transcriptional regulator [Clostridiales bacterium]
MKISTKGRYALRMMIDMAQHQKNGPVALKDISERQNVSKKYLEQIALVLSRDGVMQGTRGHQGGYCLIVDPRDCTVYDILQSVEGSMHPVACLDHAPNDCERCNGCETLYIWQGLDEVIQNYLRSITLQDVLDKVQVKE